MSMELVTGFKGVLHVTAEQDSDLQRGIISNDAVRLDIGSQMEVDIVTANQIAVKDGVYIADGREFYIGYGDTEQIEIQSGTQGQYRNDIVCIEYYRDEETAVEEARFVIIQGTPGDSGVDPSYSDTDIRTGVFTSQKPFCRVRLNGTAIEGIDMLTEVVETMSGLKAYVTAAIDTVTTAMDGKLGYQYGRQDVDNIDDLHYGSNDSTLYCHFLHSTALTGDLPFGTTAWFMLYILGNTQIAVRCVASTSGIKARNYMNDEWSGWSE